MQRSLYRIIITLLAITAISSNAYADPPNRVGRISYVQGVVSFSPVGRHSGWMSAQLNRPLVAGDRIWADAHGRAELQLGNAALRMEDATSLRILNLNDRVAQFDLSQGTITFDVRRLSSGQIYEIDTPQLAFKVTQPGNFRIDVSDAGDATIVTVRSGKGIVYTKNGSYKVKAPGSYRYYNKRFQAVRYYSDDSFDRWSFERERRVTRSRSAMYVSTSLVGYEDLDTYGNWRYVQGYGNVWMPTHTSSNWAPYRNGHWSYVNPWGWTWIDDQPWGYATSHYGRWARYNNTWVWVPGRKAAQATYAPALVAFIGGNRVSFSWIPLGPSDVYVPPYRVSKQYFTNVNVANTAINQNNINRVYNNPVAAPAYTYHQAGYAVSAAPPSTFAQSKPVAGSAPPSTTAANQAPPSTTGANQAPPSTTAVIAPPPPPADTAPPSSTAAKPSADAIDRVPVVVTPPAPPSTTTDTSGKPVEVKAATPVEQIAPPSDKAIPEASSKPEATVEPMPSAAPPSDKKESEPLPAAAPVAPEVMATPPVVDNSQREAAEQKAAQEAQAAKANADREAQLKAEQDAQAAKVNEERESKARADREAEVERANAAQANAEREASAAAQRDAERQAADRAQADQAAAAQAEANRAAAAQAEADREASARAEAERAAANQAEADRAAAAQADAERAAAAAKAEADQAAAAAQSAAPPSTFAPQ